MKAKLELSRRQILNFRRLAGGLNQRLPAGPKSLRQAAWAGLQDSVPRAALLSLHARVADTRADGWEHPSLVQLWGPRFNDYVIAAADLAVFSLGRLPLTTQGHRRAYETAENLHAYLAGRRLPFGEAGRGLGVNHNSLRYAAATGTVLLRWDGARQPHIWTTEAPTLAPADARLELARRYLHILGPGTATAYQRWAGVSRPMAQAVFRDLLGELVPVRTPVGEAFILAEDEAAFRSRPQPAAPARLLPSGDTYFLAWGADRVLLVPDDQQRAALWTSRVWPGALLVNGEFAGVWRRAGAQVTIDLWRPLSKKERAAVDAEATSLPLPSTQPITVTYSVPTAAATPPPRSAGN